MDRSPIQDYSGAIATGPHPAAAATPLRVLFVEDREDDAFMLHRALERGGYAVSGRRVETATDFDAALAEGGWDVIIADYSLPQFSGLAALERMKQLEIDLPFVIASSSIDEDTAVAALRAGAHDFVLKDRLARLVPAVARELREARVRRETHRLQEQLLLSERLAAIGTITAGIAHEINNPVAAAIANVEFTLRELATDGKVEARRLREPLLDVRDALDRVRVIVEDVKLFSRASKPLEVAAVDLTRTVDSAARMLQSELRQRAQLIREFEGATVILGNEGRLSQVFLNLLLNASQAFTTADPQRNVIRVRSYHTPATSQVVVEIVDNGRGITPDALDRIFEPFFTTKPAGIGTGLGLPICRRIIEEHRGLLEVDSKVGEGTTFRIKLPASDLVPRSVRPSTAIAAVTAPTPTPRRASILVIDDDKLLTAAIRRSLSRDHDVEVTDDPQRALDTLRGPKTYDVILCDVMMPKQSGVEFYEALSRTAPAIAGRVVFMTGSVSESEREFLRQLPNACLDKPFDTAQLRALLQRLLS